MKWIIRSTTILIMVTVSIVSFSGCSSKKTVATTSKKADSTQVVNTIIPDIANKDIGKIEPTVQTDVIAKATDADVATVDSTTKAATSMKALFSDTLKALVTDSTITQEQSDKVLEVFTKDIPVDKPNLGGIPPEEGEKPSGTATPIDGVKPSEKPPSDGKKTSGTVPKDDRLSELVISKVITQAQADTINMKILEAMERDQPK